MKRLENCATRGLGSLPSSVCRQTKSYMKHSFGLCLLRGSCLKARQEWSCLYVFREANPVSVYITLGRERSTHDLPTGFQAPAPMRILLCRSAWSCPRFPCWVHFGVGGGVGKNHRRGSFKVWNLWMILPGNGMENLPHTEILELEIIASTCRLVRLQPQWDTFFFFSREHVVVSIYCCYHVYLFIYL